MNASSSPENHTNRVPLPKLDMGVLDRNIAEHKANLASGPRFFADPFDHMRDYQSATNTILSVDENVKDAIVRIKTTMRELKPNDRIGFCKEALIKSPILSGYIKNFKRHWDMIDANWGNKQVVLRHIDRSKLDIPDEYDDHLKKKGRRDGFNPNYFFILDFVETVHNMLP